MNKKINKTTTKQHNRTKMAVMTGPLGSCSMIILLGCVVVIMMINTALAGDFRQDDNRLLPEEQTVEISEQTNHIDDVEDFRRSIFDESRRYDHDMTDAHFWAQHHGHHCCASQRLPRNLKEATNEFLLKSESLHGRTALHMAIEYDNLSMLRAYAYRGVGLEHRVVPVVTSEYNKASKLEATEDDDGENKEVKQLNEQQKYESRAQPGDTPLHLAVRWNRPGMVAWLLLYGVDKFQLTKFEHLPALALADQPEQAKIRDLLSTDLCQVLIESILNHDNVIVRAFAENRHDCIYQKVEGGDGDDVTGNYPIHVAAQVNNHFAYYAMVGMGGVNMNRLNANNETAVQVNRRFGFGDTFENIFFCAHDRDHITDFQRGPSSKVVITSNSLNVDRESANGWTDAHRVAYGVSVCIHSSTTMKQKEQEKDKMKEGKVEEDCVVAKGAGNIRTFFENANNEFLCYQDEEGRTPLHLAILSNNLDFIKYYRSRKPDCFLFLEDYVDEERKETALHYAVRYQRVEAMMHLLGRSYYRMFQNTKNAQGLTALQLARDLCDSTEGSGKTSTVLKLLDPQWTWENESGKQPQKQ